MSRQAPPGAAGGGDSLRQRLLCALDTFDATKTSRQVALEADVAALVAPSALVGRQLRLFWPDDAAWYAGTVASYDPSTGKHLIEYADGDQEAVHVAAQRIKIAVTVGADPPAADPDELEAHCDALARYAGKMKAPSAEDKELRATLQARAAELRAAAAATRARLAAAAAAPEDGVEAVAAAAPQEEAPAEAAPAAAAPPPAKKRKKGGKGRVDAATRAAAEVWASTLCPGDVVWSASVGDYPPWPAMVTTREQCADGKRPSEKKAAQDARCVPLMFFGSYERYFAAPEKLTPLRAGILEGLAGIRSGMRARDATNFRRSVGEMADYMGEGDVPERMFPNNDGEEDSEEEEEEAARGSGGGRARGGGGAAAASGLRWSSITRDPNMPLVVGSLKVLSLGQIRWLHPGFHDERAIWPVGYRAERTVRTPAGGAAPVRHLFEILEAADGSGPLFRVTPWGKAAAEGRTPNRAWAALFEAGTGSKKGGSAQLVKGAAGGARQFGLTAAPVLGAILALPGAERCERFAGWPEDAPARAPPPPLTPDELAQRLAHEAAAARLPDGVAGAPAAPTDPGVCAVCLEEEEEDEDLVLQCDRCGLFAHMSCYGVAAAPAGRLWLCDPCQAGAPSPPPACALCPVLGGALKRTDCGRWAHPACALWIPDGPFLDPSAVHCGGAKGLVRGLDAVPHERRALKCAVCAQPHGACIQCSKPGCYAAFHVTCGRQTPGYHMRMELASDDEGEEEDEAAVAAAGGSGRVTPDGVEGGAGCGSPSGDENVANGAAVEAEAPAVEAAAEADPPAAAAPLDGACTAAAPPPDGACTVEEEALGCAPGGAKSSGPVAPATTDAAEKKPTRPRKKRRGKCRSTATAADHAVVLNGARLLAFCARHNPLKTAACCAAAEDDPMDADAPSASAAAAATAEEAAAAAAAARGWPVPGYPSPWPCARAIPLDAALRRGPRAPEAMEASMAKRRYVTATPLLVGGPTPTDGGGAGQLAPEARGRCTWHPPPPAGPAAAAAAVPQPAVEQEVPIIVLDAGLQEASPSADGAPAKEGPGCPATAAAKAGTAEEGPAAAAPAAPPAAAVQDEAAEAAEAVEIGDLQSHPSNSRSDPGAASETPGPQQESTARGPDPGDAPCCPGSGAAAAGGGGAPARDDGGAVAPALAPPPRAAAAEALRSSSERYHEMRASEGARVVPGKSAIHGWGAFARVPHKKHEMVIEYVGDLVRPSVAEARERSAYDSLVGAGTYVFRLNASSCVDATRSGNLAHLLNHSCAPNCYSRTVPVWDAAAGGATDHVVIFAARDIAAWEEFTYDYRFSGEERLVCNCGAGGCRGMVNKMGDGAGGGAGGNGGVLPPGTEVPLQECRGPLAAAVAGAAEEVGGGSGGTKRQRDAA